MENLPTIEHVFYGICLSACIILPLWLAIGHIKQIAKRDALARKQKLKDDWNSERARVKQEMRDGNDGVVIYKPALLDWIDIDLIQIEIELENTNQRKGLEMIKVNVIEKEVVKKEGRILLKDCELGDVVELENSTVAIVGSGGSCVVDGYDIDGRCLLWLSDYNIFVGEDFAKDAIAGAGNGAIKRIIGTLTGIEVTAK